MIELKGNITKDGNMKNAPIRHGEIMLVPVNKIPAGKISKVNLFIVGHSETGHHHVLESKVEFEVTEADQELYFRLFEPSKLVHKKAVDKHKDLTIAPGLYKRYHDTEYSPFTRLIEAVRD